MVRSERARGYGEHNALCLRLHRRPRELVASIAGRPSLLCVRWRTWLDGHDADDQDDGPFATSTASTREAEKGRGKLAGFPDDLCLTGSHGVLCDDDDDASHVVGISLGYVSDFSVNPSSRPPPPPPPRSSRPASSGCFVGDDDARPLPPLPWRLPPTLQDLVLVNNPALSGRLAISVACLPLLCKRGGGGRSWVASGGAHG
uniref:Uncharacterized protein n=1 Tax=Oryza rufipogon TaxID=4529 RepID=A0A0E0QGN9_ORYRU